MKGIIYVFIALLGACWSVEASLVLTAIDCLQGPKSWCKNVETAKRCGVLEFCKLRWDMEVKNSRNEGVGEIDQAIIKDIAPPINVTLYFESLCPGCNYFITSQLYPTYVKLAHTGILNVELVPYGNAKESQLHGQYVYTCQHGAAECLGNMIETCAIHVLAHPAQSYTGTKPKECREKVKDRRPCFK